MVTLEKYNSKCREELRTWNLLGASNEWRNKVGELAKRINKAIMEEYGIDNKEAIGKMPGDTPLGKEADSIYQDLVRLLKSPLVARGIDWDSL